MEKSKYPKVRVKQVEEEDGYGYGLDFLSSLKAFDSLSISLSSSSQDDYPSSVARIPTAHIPTSPKPVTSASTGERNAKSRKTSSEVEAKTRGGLVSRPRAVLSSPDNDKMAGTTLNKPKAATTKVGRGSPLNKRAQTQSKAIPKTITAKNTSKVQDVGGPVIQVKRKTASRVNQSK